MRIRPPVKWHGGKYYLAERIVAMMPEHDIYVEPFGGAASVLLTKTPCRLEVYNDIDDRLTRFFRVLRERGMLLRDMLELTPYSESEFQECIEERDCNEVEAARRDYVQWRMSIGGQGKSFSYSTRRSRTGMSDVVAGFLSSIDNNLPAVIERLREVQIFNQKASWVIDKYDTPDTVIYCDPPYLPETRTAKTVYRHEMDELAHVALLERLRKCESYVILSGYDSELYNDMLSTWSAERFDLPNNSAMSAEKQRRQEILWRNY